MADIKYSPNYFRALKTETEGYIKLQQGIDALGKGIFSLARTDAPETLDNVKQDILRTGTVNNICDEEPLYESVGHLLLLSMDTSELENRFVSAYTVLAHQRNSKIKLDLEPDPLQPALPLSDYRGLARYAGQLLQHYENILQAAGRSLTDIRVDIPLMADIHERLGNLHRTLTALL